jgi:hypothetical protein
MVCLRNICINTLHKGDNNDDDDVVVVVDDDDNIFAPAGENDRVKGTFHL